MEFEGFVSVQCLGGVLSPSVQGCTARGCPAGAKTPLGVGAGTIKLPRPLADGQKTSSPCSVRFPGQTGYIRFHCTLGSLYADASTCRKPARAPRSLYRLVHEDFLPGTWRVFELSLYAQADCTGVVSGTPVASSSESITSGRHLAFDGNQETSWAAHCEGGCRPGVSWLGVVLGGSVPPEELPAVGCVGLLQSAVSCCGSRNLRLQVWDGAAWQQAAAWDLNSGGGGGAGDADGGGRARQKLVVPATCPQRPPPDLATVHDCVGRPVVGIQAGDFCHVSCTKGFFGPRTRFVCEESGELRGEMPTCHSLQVVEQGGTILGFVLAAVFVAWLYRFYFMMAKLRIPDDPDLLLDVMAGRWHEKNGVGLWDAVLAAEHEDDERGVDDELPGDASGGASPGASPKDGDASPRGKVSPRGKKRSPRAGGSQSPGGGRSPRGGSPRGTSSRKRKPVGSGQEAKKKGNMKADILDARKNLVTEKGIDEELVDPDATAKQRLRATGRLRGGGRVFLDGLCSPCEDPDLCCVCLCCPLCRIADTWHTIGSPAKLSYWRVLLAYVMCPMLWPCLNFYGRLRIRRAFEIPLEPHRDAMVHCFCCCCCAPCALCQEARTTDAPNRLATARHDLRALQEEGLRV